MKRLLCLVALAACAGREPVTVPLRVDVPVSLPCAAPAVARPDFALGRVVATDDLYEKTRAALIELDQRKAYEVGLAAAADGCR